ncbi:MAG: hypothetical protein ACRCYU_03600 [Nocardioides sp.]
MSLVIYGPDASWPRHQKAYWNTALDAARARGWTYEYLGAAHKSGVLVCPAGEHTVTVDKTARGGECFAARATKIITSRCLHGTGDVSTGKVKGRIEDADRLLTSAESLIAAARTDLDSIEARAAGDERLKEVDDLRLRLDSADLTLAELESLEEAALEEALVEAPTPAAVEGLLAEASDNVATASRTLGKVRKHASLRGLSKRMAVARTEIDRLRARLKSFVPND